MLANPDEGVDTIGTFSALEETTETPTDATVSSAEETVNPEPTVETAPEPGLKPPEETDSKDNPEPRIFKAKLDGKDIELEVKNGDVDLESIPTSLMMTHTFYKKTEELANERKAFEEKAQEFDAQLNELRSQLDYGLSELESPEMQELKQDDPGLYWEKYGELKSKHDKFRAFTEKRQAEMDRKHQEMVQREIANWEVTIPEWQNEDVKKKESGELFNFLVEEGFAPEMVGQIYDSRLVKLLRQGMLYKKAASKDIRSTKPPQKHVSSNSTATSKPVETEDIPLEQIFYGSE